ncbi:MAG: tRNA A-37 threonylcarbamoyl transferase component Bud32 [Candidatus Binatia bacterium]|jgi:tRNA A-37 threonylcarbamoyl transferase component Bud32
MKHESNMTGSVSGGMTCGQCGAPLPVDAPKGICPQCLLKVGLESSNELSANEDGPVVMKAPVGDESSAVCDAGAELGRIRYFGDYEIEEEIARGGMGVVYKARQTSLNRTVAIKMILSGQLADDEEVRRFRTEAEAAANLQHPNIVAIHEVGEHEGQQYFSMDYVAGKGLSDQIREGPLSPSKAAAYVKTIAEAIQYAHQRGILHRDLKPSNILIDDQDRPRITDFGLAKNLEKDSALTQTGAILGSPAYMPPEQANGDVDQLGTHSDVYSLGAVLYELITGRPPFRGKTPIETLIQVRDQIPKAPSALNPHVPQDLEAVCLKCLEKEPLRRYATARQLGQDLERFLDRKPVEAQPMSRARRVWGWLTAHPWALTAATSLLALVLFAAMYRLWAENRFLRWENAHPELRASEYQAFTDHLWFSLTAFFTAPLFWIMFFARPLNRKAFARKRLSGRPVDPGKIKRCLFAGLTLFVLGCLWLLKALDQSIGQSFDLVMITMLGNAPIAFGAIWVASRYVWDAWREYHFAWNSSVADRINDAKLVIAEERGKKILAMAEGTPNSPRLLLLGAFELIAFLAIGYYLDRWLSRENPYELHVIAYACAGICAWFVGVSGLHFQGAARTGKRVFHGGVLAAAGLGLVLIGIQRANLPFSIGMTMGLIGGGLFGWLTLWERKQSEYRLFSGEANAETYLRLARAFATGDGVSKDAVEAFKWLCLAETLIPTDHRMSEELKHQKQELESGLKSGQLAEARRRASDFQKRDG